MTALEDRDPGDEQVAPAAPADRAFADRCVCGHSRIHHANGACDAIGFRRRSLILGGIEQCGCREFVGEPAEGSEP